MIPDIFKPQTKADAERKGRFWRITGIPRSWIVENCQDVRKADILRGWDASEKAGEALV